MFGRTIAVGFAALLAAVPAAAQQRGSIEFGAFGSNSAFDAGLGIKNSFGLGARLGVFVLPRLSIEFEGGTNNAGRTLGFQNVNVGVLAARMTVVPLKFGPLSVLFGGGVDHTSTNFMNTYGWEALLGAKLNISNSIALRVDGIQSYMVNGKYTNMAMHVGFAIYRNPGRLTRTSNALRLNESDSR